MASISCTLSRLVGSIRKEVLDNIGLGGPIKPQDTVWGQGVEERERIWRQDEENYLGILIPLGKWYQETMPFNSNESHASVDKKKHMNKISLRCLSSVLKLIFLGSLIISSHKSEGFYRNSTNDCLLYLNTWGLPPWAHWSLDMLMGWVNDPLLGGHIWKEMRNSSRNVWFSILIQLGQNRFRS